MRSWTLAIILAFAPADPDRADVLNEMRRRLRDWSEQTEDRLPTERTPDEFDRETGERTVPRKPDGPRRPKGKAAGAEKPATKRPNVLFIAIDDLNDRVGCLGGHPQAHTPNLDRLASRGTLFGNAHCQAPLCNPSRTSVLLGLRPTTTGVYGLAPYVRSDQRFRDAVSIPRHFASHGYRTLSTGKIWHGGYPPKPDRDREFETWSPGFPWPRPSAKFVQTPDQTPLMDWGPFPERDEQLPDFRATDWAIRQLQSTADDRPFFLAVGYWLPHVPCYAPQPWFDRFPEAAVQLPPVRDDDRADTPEFSWYLHWKLPEPRLSWLRRTGQWRPLVRAYLASTAFMDAQLGRLLDALERSPHADNTVVVAWSDHGWHLGEKAITGKNTLWERSTRVPLVFAGPGVSRGAVCRQPAELLDLFPTLNELCGLPPVSGLEGRSLLPQLRDAAAPRDRPAITTHNAGNHAVRSERYRLIRYADGSEELYDLMEDPNEWTNRANDPSLATVKRELEAWLPKTSAEPMAGSRHRILTYDGRRAVWEGEPIDPARKEE